MVTEQGIISHYELFFSKVSGYLDFIFEPSKRELVLIQNFIRLIDSRYSILLIDRSFIFDYFSYQFSRKYDRSTRFGKGILPLNNVVGPKSLNEWNLRDEYWKYHVDIFLEKFNIKLKDVRGNYSDLIIQENKERERYYNTLQGLNNCMLNDIEFLSRSKFCLLCKFKKDCKKYGK